MAGTVLTQSQRDLAQASDANWIAFKKKSEELKQAQAVIADLQTGIAALSKENGELTRALVAEQTRTQTLISELMDKDREIADALAWARVWKMAASKWFGATAPEAKP